MKTKQFILVAVLLTALFTAAVSCSKNEPEEPLTTHELIIGTWKMTELYSNGIPSDGNLENDGMYKITFTQQTVTNGLGDSSPYTIVLFDKSQMVRWDELFYPGFILEITKEKLILGFGADLESIEIKSVYTKEK